MQGTRFRPSQTQTGPFILFSGVFCILLILVFFHLSVNNFVHPLYNGAGILFAFLASLVILAMATQHSLVLQMLSVLLTSFYTQRVVITYFIPENFEYDYRIIFTAQETQIASQFYFLCVLFMLLGVVILRPLLTEFFNSRRDTVCVDFTSINYFGVRVDFSKLCRIATLIVIIGYFYKFLLLILGLGHLAGSIYLPSDSIRIWTTGIADALSGFALFSWIYFPKSSRDRNLATAAMFLVVLNSFAMASKGFFMSLAINYYIIARLIDKKTPIKFIIYVVLMLVISVFILFPAMKIIRSSLLAGDLSFDIDYFFELLANALLSFSSRLGCFDWMTLWLSVPHTVIPSSATALSELIGLINKFVPGEIIAQHDVVNLSKLQDIIGYGLNLDIDERGGHGANASGLGTVYIIWGKFMALAYLAIWAGCLTALEKTRLHPFHNAMIFGSYLVSFVIGGGFVLMHDSFFRYLFLTIFLVIALRYHSPYRSPAS